jgi:hypothetical protein
MMASLDIQAASLPIIWDADFLYGPPSQSGKDTFVLCEINVSSVFAIPEQAPAEIARLAAARLGEREASKIEHDLLPKPASSEIPCPCYWSCERMRHV